MGRAQKSKFGISDVVQFIDSLPALGNLPARKRFDINPIDPLQILENEFHRLTKDYSTYYTIIDHLSDSKHAHHLSKQHPATYTKPTHRSKLLLAMTLHSRDEAFIPDIVYAMSLLCYEVHNIPGPILQILQLIGLIVSPTTMKRRIEDGYFDAPIPEPPPFSSIILDNCEIVKKSTVPGEYNFINTIVELNVGLNFVNQPNLKIGISSEAIQQYKHTDLCITKQEIDSNIQQYLDAMLPLIQSASDEATASLGRHLPDCRGSTKEKFPPSPIHLQRIHVEKQLSARADAIDTIRFTQSTLTSKTNQTIIPMVGDHHLQSRLWELWLEEPAFRSSTLIGMGHLHYDMNLIQAIYKLGFGDLLLAPTARWLKLEYVDAEGKHYTSCSDYLERFTVAILDACADDLVKFGWKSLLMKYCTPDGTPSNGPGYLVLFLAFYIGVPYLHRKAALRAGSVEEVERSIQYFLPIFDEMNRYKYIILSIRRLLLARLLPENLMEILRESEVLSMSGLPKHHLAADAGMEHYVGIVKQMLRPPISNSKIERVERACDTSLRSRGAVYEFLGHETWEGVRRHSRKWLESTRELGKALKKNILDSALQPSTVTHPINLPGCSYKQQSQTKIKDPTQRFFKAVANVVNSVREKAKQILDVILPDEELWPVEFGPDESIDDDADGYEQNRSSAVPSSVSTVAVKEEYETRSKKRKHSSSVATANKENAEYSKAKK
eukprot:TRINITY_DN2827_c0_g1::TRINITY_DN2827_c0_g1_i1::g.5997::m.5997 TRINITY_DN2827_c0_g1::TRINITY_DN2827_c0_g1_i1::g.5997  ORF type:complete len:722 (-),score=32.44 TRINITY_DN2827_c0_g1_i1:4-2169(-)